MFPELDLPSGDDARGFGWRRRGILAFYQTRRNVFFHVETDVRYEPVTPFGDRLDQFIATAGQLECLAQLGNRPRQAFVSAMLDLPDTVDQGIARHDFPA